MICDYGVRLEYPRYCTPDEQLYNGIIRYFYKRWSKFYPKYDYDSLFSKLIVNIDKDVPTTSKGKKININLSNVSDIVYISHEFNKVIADEVLCGLGEDLKRKISKRLMI